MPSSVALTSPPDKPRAGVGAQIFRYAGADQVLALGFCVAVRADGDDGRGPTASRASGRSSGFSGAWSAPAPRRWPSNRWADWDYDVFNPRTMRRFHARHTPLDPRALHRGTDRLRRRLRAAQPTLPRALPVACVMILGYSLTKRFTAYSHAFLGLALAAAPMGAWAAHDRLARIAAAVAARRGRLVLGPSDSTSSTPRRTSNSTGRRSSILFPARHGVAARAAISPRPARPHLAYTHRVRLAGATSACHIGLRWDLSLSR